MKKTGLILIQLLVGFLLFGQWDNSGSQNFTHGTNSHPRIQGSGAILEFVQNSNAPNSSITGLRFSLQGTVTPISEAFFRYNTTNNAFIMSDNSNITRFTFDVDGDGTMLTDGRIVISSDGTPFSNDALRIEDGRDIEFDNGSGSEIIWLSSTSDEQAHLRSTGSNQDIDLELQAGTVTLDGDEVLFRIRDERRMELSNNQLNLDGILDINTARFDTAIRVDEDEALWYNGSYFRWGFGAEYNFIADEVRIGGSGVGIPTFQLEVVGDANISGELTAASDRRLKKNIKDIHGALSSISKLNPKTYNFRVDEFPDMDLAEGDKMGFIAQEIEKVLPELVRIGREVEGIDGNTFNSKSVNYVELIPLLTKAIQEQQEIIESQDEKMPAMQSKLDEVLSMVAALSSNTQDSLKTTSED